MFFVILYEKMHVNGSPWKGVEVVKSAPGRNRTCDLALRRDSLYPLSYRGRKQAAGRRRPLVVVEEKGIEPSTFALRTRRSPN